MEDQNWIDPEGVDSRGWVRSHRETEVSSPEGVKRTAYGTDFSNPQGQYEYQEWNGQRDPLGKNVGQWHEQKDYQPSSPEILSRSNRPQDLHINAQTQQHTDPSKTGFRDAPSNVGGEASEVKQSESRVNHSDLPSEWNPNEQGRHLRDDGQYDENSESKYGGIDPTTDPRRTPVNQNV